MLKRMEIIHRICGIFLAVLLLQSLSGCDMFRRMGGRPTAADLERLKLEKLAAEEAASQRRIDSLARVQAEKEDSIAILDSLAQMKGTILNPSEMGGLFTTRLDSKYYIVVGSFRSRHNAETLFEEVSGKGYVPILVNFRNGFNAVAISPSNNLRSVFNSLKRVKEESFCPADVWILVNE